MSANKNHKCFKNLKMKKFFIFLIFILLMSQINIAKATLKTRQELLKMNKFGLNCYYPSGRSYPKLVIDQKKKIVNMNKFQMDSTRDNIKVSFGTPSDESTSRRFYFMDINLTKYPVIIRYSTQALDTTSSEFQKAYTKKNLFSLLEPNSLTIILKCYSFHTDKKIEEKMKQRTFKKVIEAAQKKALEKKKK